MLFSNESVTIEFDKEMKNKRIFYISRFLINLN